MTDTRPATPGPSHPAAAHDVVVVGGGNAGISLAARLRRDGFEDVALVEPRETHLYRPLLNYVGGGQASMREAARPMASVVPDGVHWYRDQVLAADPHARSVTLASGRVLTGRDLVLCPGMEADWDRVPGAREAVMAPTGCSTYVDERAEHTWELVRGLRQGSAVFVVEDGPVGCAGAALKPLFLAADHWRRTGALDSIDVTLALGWPTVYGLRRVDEVLTAAAERYGIRVVTGARLQSVDAVSGTLRWDAGQGAEGLHYDLLNLVPRHRAPTWVAESGLSGGEVAEPGMVEVDPETLAHRRYEGVWALGDAADVQASRSGGGLRPQAAVVAENITARRQGGEYTRYDGYTTTPITVARDLLTLAEFDRDGRPTPSVPWIDLVRPRRLTWLYDRYLQPQLYWHGILKGRVSS